MDNDAVRACMVSSWYQDLADHTFPTSFVKLSEAETAALAEGEVDGDIPAEVQRRLRLPMSSFPGNCFVFTDSVAPTDTERFRGKRGAVYSPESAWRYLAESEKVREAARKGLCGHICVRPFRRMSIPREFRLFIEGSELKAMSQYWLVRHFRRLEGRKDAYWSLASSLVKEISWRLPLPDVVMDIYVTGRNEILILDFNPWGLPTSPLLLRTWDRDWNYDTGIKLIAPPTKLSGDVNVSF
ncbi:MAG: hypothetical protein JW808_02450 [Victivallales bacterium]|nr:hypothetical protein [Victivallales bacterium]